MVAILLVPQAIAYAYLTGMPPQYGLYAAIVPIIIYALMTTTPHLAIGPVAISAILIAAGIGQLAVPFSPEYIELVILTGLMIGILQLIFGLVRLGRIINLISHPVISGFASAAAIIIMVSQLSDILGITMPRFDYLYQSIEYIIIEIANTNLLTFSIAVIALVSLVLLKLINEKLPVGLIVVGLGIAISYGFELSEKGVELIGHVPAGLPSFSIPTMSLDKCLIILPTVLFVSIIGIIECIGIAKAIENKNDFYKIDTNQELFALGFSKIFGSLFSALPSSGSFSRSAILHETKGKTSLASLISVIFVVLALLFATPLLFHLPKVILAVIIVFAVRNLFDFEYGIFLFKVHKRDFLVMLTTFLVTLLVSIEIGVLTGFILSFIMLLIVSKRPGRKLLNVIRQNFKKNFQFNDEQENCGNQEISISIHGEMNFANIENLKSLITKRLKDRTEVNELNFAFDNLREIDSSGLKALKDIKNEMEKRGIQFIISKPNSKIKNRLENATNVIGTLKIIP